MCTVCIQGQDKNHRQEARTQRHKYSLINFVLYTKIFRSLKFQQKSFRISIIFCLCVLFVIRICCICVAIADGRENATLRNIALSFLFLSLSVLPSLHLPLSSLLFYFYVQFRCPHVTFSLFTYTTHRYASRVWFHISIRIAKYRKQKRLFYAHSAQSK